MLRTAANIQAESAWSSVDREIGVFGVDLGNPPRMCHIFGLTARGEGVDQLYGLKDGRLQARGY